MAANANKDATVAAEASPVQGAQLVQVPKAIVKRATRVMSHVEPATAHAVASIETETTSQASWTLQCQGVTLTQAEKSDTTVV